MTGNPQQQTQNPNSQEQPQVGITPIQALAQLEACNAQYTNFVQLLDSIRKALPVPDSEQMGNLAGPLVRGIALALEQGQNDRQALTAATDNIDHLEYAIWEQKAHFKPNVLKVLGLSEKWEKKEPEPESSKDTKPIAPKNAKKGT